MISIAIAFKRQHARSLPIFWLAAVFVSLLPAMNIPGRGLAGAFEYRYTLAAHVISAILLADLALRFARAKRCWGTTWDCVAIGFVIAYLGWAGGVTLSTSATWRMPGRVLAEDDRALSRK